jgi:hypothetical protein
MGLNKSFRLNAKRSERVEDLRSGFDDEEELENEALSRTVDEISVILPDEDDVVPQLTRDTKRKNEVQYHYAHSSLTSHKADNISTVRCSRSSRKFF